MNVNRALLEALKSSEEKFHTIFDASQDAIILSDFGGRVIELNPYFKNLLGLEFSNPDKPLNIFDFVPASFHIFLSERLNSLKRGEILQFDEIPIRTVQNKEILFEVRRSAITYHKEELVLTIGRDVTERNLFQKKMLKATIEIEERERRKLASDLHDDVGPLLSAINMHLSLLARKEELLKYSDSIHEISLILKDAITTVREISNNLSPHILINYGLPSALKAFFETKSNILPVFIEYHPTDMLLPEKIQLILYRISEELYNNSLKHSNADQVLIRMELSGDNLTYLYTDNGIGFNVDGLLKETNTGMGLINIFNRIKAVNGTRKVKTAPGQGFSMEFTIPNIQVF
jgi:PAS domain S-box-containing protein